MLIDSRTGDLRPTAHGVFCSGFRRPHADSSRPLGSALPEFSASAVRNTVVNRASAGALSRETHSMNNQANGFELGAVVILTATLLLGIALGLGLASVFN